MRAEMRQGLACGGSLVHFHPHPHLVEKRTISITLAPKAKRVSRGTIVGQAAVESPPRLLLVETELVLHPSLEMGGDISSVTSKKLIASQIRYEGTSAVHCIAPRRRGRGKGKG